MDVKNRIWTYWLSYRITDIVFQFSLILISLLVMAFVEGVTIVFLRDGFPKFELITITFIVLSCVLFFFFITFYVAEGYFKIGYLLMLLDLAFRVFKVSIFLLDDITRAMGILTGLYVFGRVLALREYLESSPLLKAWHRQYEERE